MGRGKRFVYAARAGSSSAVKFGITDNIQQRLARMQTDSSEPLYLVSYIEGSRAEAVEQRLHAMLKSRSLRREWFDVPNDEDVARLLDEAAARVGHALQNSGVPAEIIPEYKEFFVRRGNQRLSTADFIDALIGMGFDGAYFSQQFKHRVAAFALERHCQFVNSAVTSPWYTYGLELRAYHGSPVLALDAFSRAV